MRILLCNYRYFISGGPEQYMFNAAEALTGRGHEVIPFSIVYPRNRPTPYCGYFVKPLGGSDEVYFRQQKLTPETVWNSLARLFYAKDVHKAVTLLAKDTRPQVAYILHYLRKLSPSLLAGLKQSGIPIVVRLSDFGMICPQAHCVRDERPCELCVAGNLLPSIRYRCVQGSLAASVLNFLATEFHKMRHYFDLVDRFVVTTEFMYQKMLEAGYAKERLCLIPTFVNGEIFHPEAENVKKNHIAYAGRLVPIKGVHVLIEAFSLMRANRPDLDITLKIAGGGDENYIAGLRQQVHRLKLEDSVIFSGEQDADGIVALLNKAFLSIVPSLWYENLPNAVLESFACGTPVLASNLGSLTECVADGKTGYLFRPGDSVHLAERLEFCIDHPEHIAEIGRNARRIAETTYSKKRHLEKLEELFVDLTGTTGLSQAGVVGEQEVS